MGVPEPDRPYISEPSAKASPRSGRGEYDGGSRMTDGLKGMIDYVSPWIDERLANSRRDFISAAWQEEESRACFTTYQAGAGQFNKNNNHYKRNL